MTGRYLVHKFGGTSLGDARRLRRAAGIVTGAEPLFPGATREAAYQQVVVVSALAGITDLLIGAARAAASQDQPTCRDAVARLAEIHQKVVAELFNGNASGVGLAGWVAEQVEQLHHLLQGIYTLGELTPRTRDRVVAYGETLSAQILAVLLSESGCPAVPVSAAELIVTDDRYGQARPRWEETNQRVLERLPPLGAAGITPVITGYIAATAAGIPTTLGRGGSDYSAAILGSCLEAVEVWIWSDVNGILTADPNLDPEATPLRELSYGEAGLLAAYGADVLHPKTIQPLVEKGIPLRLLNSFFPVDEGTRIVQFPQSGRELPPAIISVGGLSLLTLDGGEAREPLAWSAEILGSLHSAGLDAPMFSRSFADRRLNLFIRRADQDHCLQILKHNVERNYELEVLENVAMISIVGFQPPTSDTILRPGLSALGGSGARLIALAQAGHGNAISVCIPEEQLLNTVRHLHRELRTTTRSTPEHALVFS